MNQMLYLFVLILIAFIGYFTISPIFRRLLSNCESKYIKKNMEYSSTENFAAIILIKKSPDDDIGLFTQGICWLLKYFKNINQSYKVYLNPNPREFKQIVNDEKADRLYIFGHGKRNCLKFESGLYIKYKELKDYPKKQFIGQYHCNHGGGKSLADYIEVEEKDISNFYRFNLLTYFKFLLKYVNSKI